MWYYCSVWIAIAIAVFMDGHTSFIVSKQHQYFLSDCAKQVYVVNDIARKLENVDKVYSSCIFMPDEEKS